MHRSYWALHHATLVSDIRLSRADAHCRNATFTHPNSYFCFSCSQEPLVRRHLGQRHASKQSCHEYPSKRIAVGRTRTNCVLMWQYIVCARPISVLQQRLSSLVQEAREEHIHILDVFVGLNFTVPTSTHGVGVYRGVRRGATRAHNAKIR
jgi:hypothetical protein